MNHILEIGNRSKSLSIDKKQYLSKSYDYNPYRIIKIQKSISSRNKGPSHLFTNYHKKEEVRNKILNNNSNYYSQQSSPIKFQPDYSVYK